MVHTTLVSPILHSLALAILLCFLFVLFSFLLLYFGSTLATTRTYHEKQSVFKHFSLFINSTLSSLIVSFHQEFFDLSRFTFYFLTLCFISHIWSLSSKSMWIYVSTLQLSFEVPLFTHHLSKSLTLQNSSSGFTQVPLYHFPEQMQLSIMGEIWHNEDGWTHFKFVVTNLRHYLNGVHQYFHSSLVKSIAPLPRLHIHNFFWCQTYTSFHSFSEGYPIIEIIRKLMWF